MKKVLVMGSTGAMGRYFVPDTDVGKRMDEYLEKMGFDKR